MAVTSTSPNAIPASPATHAYHHALGHLRAFVVVLVVWHHAMLAYYPAGLLPPASLAAQPRWWQAFPVIDPQKWSLAPLFVGFNDIFFMSLMFFLSGLFVWRGLARKGISSFLRNRLLRLGLPFVVATALLAPLAYYPTYLQMQGHGGVSGFWRQWLSIGVWPSGPSWFVSVLLAFDCVAALLFAVLPGSGPSIGLKLSFASSKPWRFFVVLGGFAAVAYVPMTIAFSPLAWAAWGPFTFQTSRILSYFVYFLFGVCVGAHGVEQGLLAPDGKLARRWPLWSGLALLLFFAAIALTFSLAAMPTHPILWGILAGCGAVASCAASSFAFLALFVRFAQARSRAFDSLNANSYAIYLVHYGFVSWLQYVLLPASVPGFAKAFLVLFGALGLSWGTAALLRRIPSVARVI